jgi:hypothetical protein
LSSCCVAAGGPRLRQRRRARHQHEVRVDCPGSAVPIRRQSLDGKPLPLCSKLFRIRCRGDHPPRSMGWKCPRSASPVPVPSLGWRRL